MSSTPSGTSADRSPSGRRVLVAWAVSVVLAGLVAWVHAAARPGEVMQTLSDAALLVPIAIRQAHPELFGSDHWLTTTAPVFSRWYSFLLAPLLDATDDPVVALRWISFACHAALLAGTWRLAARFAGEWAGALAAVVVAVLPQNPPWLFAVGLGLPRDVVFAAFPWFALALCDTSPTTHLRSALPYLVLGALTNVHPLTGVHMFVLLVAVRAVVDPRSRRPVPALVVVAAFFAGAAPYVVQYLSLPSAQGAVDPVVYAWDLRGIAGETPLEWTQRMEGAIWLALAAAGIGVAARRAGSPLPRALVLLTLGALAVGAVAGVLTHVVPSLRSLQFARMSRFAALSGAVCAAVGAVTLLRERRWGAPLAAAGVLAAAAMGPEIVGWVSGGPPRGLLAHCARAVERACDVPYQRPAPADLPRRNLPGDPADAAHRADFLQVCDFCRRSTDPADLFLVPPENWAPFRAYARRSVSVTRKEAGAALTFLGARGMDWYRDYVESVRTYESGDAAAWEAAAAKWGARFAVVDAGTRAPPWPEMVFAAGPYRVLRVPGR